MPAKNFRKLFGGGARTSTAVPLSKEFRLLFEKPLRAIAVEGAQQLLLVTLGGPFVPLPWARSCDLRAVFLDHFACGTEHRLSLGPSTFEVNDLPVNLTCLTASARPRLRERSRPRLPERARPPSARPRLLALSRPWPLPPFLLRSGLRSGLLSPSRGEAGRRRLIERDREDMAQKVAEKDL
eukprot:CAMPEP_0117504710 /NCGR_PEP_ID=MMETSP0784-20121206/24991_1 /TAXON_ID=39447 /ORGANISM="" /LENGTH=181 /DNA_ID=CAMNT_0005300077 /DNA_START=154 /DNA_END=696 /DNA_ORIENTATION=-